MLSQTLADAITKNKKRLRNGKDKRFSLEFNFTALRFQNFSLHIIQYEGLMHECYPKHLCMGTVKIV